MSLNTEQESVIELISKGCNVFTSGAAGCGKSFLISYLVEELEKKRKCYRLLASTGIAAVNIGGMTIHKFLSITPNIKTLNDYIKLCMKRSKVPWNTLDCIIIDEISMIHPKFFYLFNEIAQLHRRNSLPFGGIQMILIGDLFQLSYIPEENDIKEETYIFNSALWKAMKIRNCILKTVMRQNDTEFIEALADLRIGKYSKKVKDMMTTCKNNTREEGKHYVNLFALNVLKNCSNDEQMKKLDTESRTFTSIDNGDVKSLNGCRAEQIIQLKVNCPVMLLWNMSEYKLYNGSVGVVTEFCKESGLPIVQFNDGPLVKIDRKEWSICQRNKYHKMETIASRKQIPLSIAYAITCHKAQGLSIDHVEVDCRGIFTTGQLYVALSRARTKTGLIIKNFNRSCIMVDKRIVEFYEKVDEVNENDL